MEGQSEYVKNETYRIYSKRWIRKEHVGEYLVTYPKVEQTHVRFNNAPKNCGVEVR